VSKLWSKGYELDALMEEFTVGVDYILDKRLVPSDIIGSLAHATMLKDVGLLDEEQLLSLRKGLLAVLDEHKKGDFIIERSDEDGHTALENRLVELIGDAGKRIHLGRSRNDQILTVTRIWMRQYILNLVDAGATLVSDLLTFAERNKAVPMPGRTHMQPAMPSSVGLWAGGFAEQLLDDIKGAAALYPYFDQCPLGSAAGYGAPLPLNRELSAELLGFSRVQVNVSYGGLSRGKFESRLLDTLDQVAITLSKLAQDLILFSLPEFGWFTLPQELCTGSSIMPQKRNPDGLELMRAKAESVGAWAQQVKAIIRSLPSGYNRDFQDTKEPLLKAADTVDLMIRVGSLTIRKLNVNEEKLVNAFDPGVFATDSAIALVAGGMSFRDAYHEVGTHPEKYSGGDPYSAIGDRTSTGTAGNLRLDLAVADLEALKLENDARAEMINGALEKLAGRPVPII
jgi:argininosuccinate lyase